MDTVPVNFELVTDVLEELGALVEHGLNQTVFWDLQLIYTQDI
jgi:hypothetical protein